MSYAKIILSSVFVAITSNSWASVEGELGSCLSIDDAQQRLVCFESIALKINKNNYDNNENAVAISDLNNGYQFDFMWNNETQRSTLPLSNLDVLFDINNDDKDAFVVRPYHASYFLPVFYNSHLNEAPESPTEKRVKQFNKGGQKTEAKFQLSFKVKLADDILESKTDAWFAYTQSSYWQIYNRKSSSPFKETTYEPELFVTYPTDIKLPLNGQLRLIGMSFNHQSNGESRPLSRGWNRVIGFAGMQWGSLTVMPRIWARVNANKHDNNPDIKDYMGNGELVLAYQLPKKHEINSVAHYQFKSGKGGLGVNYSFPLTKQFRGMVQAYHGYGMSLLDYNHKNTSLGIGVMLNQRK